MIGLNLSTSLLIGQYIISGQSDDLLSLDYQAHDSVSKVLYIVGLEPNAVSWCCDHNAVVAVYFTLIY